MPRICYKQKRFGEASLLAIDRANRICREYAAAGYDLTLRQLYYQFVSRDWIANNQKSYNRLGKIVNDARMAGLIDWDYIVDRTRSLRGVPHFNDIPHAVSDMARRYREDKWKDQPNRVEVWIEKDALVGVLESACPAEDVSFFSCRGYTSQSEVWGAAQRIGQYINGGQRVVILHLGDHDPSGVDMTRDVSERIQHFLACDFYLGGMSAENAVKVAHNAFEVRRIALNMDQIDEYNPPPNPAKFTDARYRKYVETHGRSCWELDALPPDVLVALIQDSIAEERDPDLWEEAVAHEQEERRKLRIVSERWSEIEQFLQESA